MKKLFVCLYPVMVLFFLCSCSQEAANNTTSEVAKNINGTWEIKEVTMDISERNLVLMVSNDGTWKLKEGGRTDDHGSYTLRKEKYVFKSDKTGEIYTTGTSLIGQNILELKIDSNRGMKLKASAMRAFGEPMPKTETAPYGTNAKKMNEMSEADKCKQTEGSMRSISTALEAYAVDWGSYPSGGLENLKSVLSPAYIKIFPMTDGWGNRWVYELYYMKNDPSLPHIKIISKGRNGVLEYKSAEDIFTCDDIVIIDSRFMTRCSNER